MNEVIEKIGEVGVIEINSDLIIEYIDPALNHYFEQPEQLVGTKITSVPEFKDCNLSAHINQLAKEKSIWKRIDLNGNNGKKQILLEADPLMGRSGTLKRAVFLLIDLSTLKKKWGIFNLSLSNYKNITDAIPSGIIVTDTNGRIRFSNPVAEKMLGEAFKRKRKLPGTLKMPAGTSREIAYTAPGKDLFFLDVTVTETKWFGKPAQLYVLHDITTLRKSEDQNMLLLTAIQSAANAMAIVSYDFSLKWVNPAFTELTGWSMEEAMDSKISDLVNVNGNLEESFIDNIRDIVSKAEIYRTELHRLRKDGTYFDCELTISPFTDGISGHKQYIFVFNDLTQRKELENILTILNEVFTSLQKADSFEESFIIIRDELLKSKIHSVIYLLDEDEKVIAPHYFSFETKLLEQYANVTGSKFESLSIPVRLSEKYTQILKQKRTFFSHDVAGDLLRIVPSLPPELLQNKIRSYGIQHSISAPILDKNQNVFAIFQLLSDKLTEGNVPQVIAFSNHLSFFLQKIQLLKELRENYDRFQKSYLKSRASETRYKELFYNDLTGNYVTTPKGKFLDCNQAFIDIMGYRSKEEVLASGPHIYFANKERRRAFLELLKKEKRIINHEEKLVRKDGKKIYVAINAYSTFDARGQLQQIKGYIYDITQRKQYEEELIHAKERAEESNRLKTAFLANISHEIRTPINAIVGFNSLLIDEQLSVQERKKYHRIITSNINQMLSLLDDLIKMAEIESGTLKINTEKVNIYELLYNVYLTFEADARLKEKDVALTLDVDESHRQFITVDSVKIREVLENLISNSIKFTKTGSIHFGYTQTAPDKLTFYVRDTGIGIPEDQHKKIFERFRQADNTMTRKYEGAGLGLAICKSYIEMIGGEIWVESLSGKGSTFYFTLPVKQTKSEKV